MKVLELFAGTRSIGKAFEEKGHKVYSVDWNKEFENINLYTDISTLTAEYIISAFGKPDVIWASPDCTSYSVAAISYHRRKERSVIPEKLCKHIVDICEGVSNETERYDLFAV